MRRMRRRSVPIEGQSHWCEGYTAKGRGCTQIVRNDSDRCKAGHANHIMGRTVLSINSEFDALASSGGIDGLSLEATSRTRTRPNLGYSPAGEVRWEERHSGYSDTPIYVSGSVIIERFAPGSGYLLHGRGVLNGIFPTLELAERAAEYPAPGLEWVSSKAGGGYWGTEGELPRLPQGEGVHSVSFTILEMPAGTHDQNSVTYEVRAVRIFERRANSRAGRTITPMDNSDSFSSVGEAQVFAQELFENAYRETLELASQQSSREEDPLKRRGPHKTPQDSLHPPGWTIVVSHISSRASKD